MAPCPPAGRSRGSGGRPQTSVAKSRARGACKPSLLASVPSSGKAKGADLNHSQQRSSFPGDIIPEWWARSFRNGGRHHPGKVGGIISDSVGGLLRNQHL